LARKASNLAAGVIVSVAVDANSEDSVVVVVVVVMK
jgi:hypothetical protein